MAVSPFERGVPAVYPEGGYIVTKSGKRVSARIVLPVNGEAPEIETIRIIPHDAPPSAPRYNPLYDDPLPPDPSIVYAVPDINTCFLESPQLEQKEPQIEDLVGISLDPEQVVRWNGWINMIQQIYPGKRQLIQREYPEVQGPPLGIQITHGNTQIKIYPGGVGVIEMKPRGQDFGDFLGIEDVHIQNTTELYIDSQTARGVFKGEKVLAYGEK